MKRKINLHMSMLAFLTCVLTFAVMFAVSHQNGRVRMELDTTRQTALVAAGLEQVYALSETRQQEYLETIGKSGPSRVTVIAPDGTVFFDSGHDPALMENHLARPEVQEALQNGVGQSTRVSDTMGEQTFYAAQRLSTGEILRLSNTVDLIAYEMPRAAPLLLLITLGVCILSLGMAHHLTARLIAPIRALNLEQPLGRETYEELTPLMSKLREQKAQINHQIALFRRRQIEFESIMNNMSEGLVMLDDALTILSANNAAVFLLGAESRDWQGESLLRLSRDITLHKKARKAAKGKKSSMPYEGRLGRHLQIYCSPVEVDGAPHGCVLLIVDVSERYAAERSRREFTANVSHELKTPLTSISGYAEMVSLGLVKDDDVRSFAGRIHAEAAHLIGLVNDIIKLSRLDESIPSALPFEQVELYTLTAEVLERLTARAKKQQVTLHLAGEPALVHGMRQTLSEMVFNLCDNAIKYGRAGGKVQVEVRNVPEGVRLVVEDDGRGIAPADQSRIFERFYRADKSHSRAVEGTGLGLAIVKHACELHGGTIRLESAPDEGSRFILTLPPDISTEIS